MPISEPSTSAGTKALEPFQVVRVPFPITDRAVQRQACVVRLKLFSLDERLILGWLGRLAPADRSGVGANLQRLLPEQEPQP